MLKELFAVGNRKTIITVIGLLLSLFGNKFGLNMDDKMQETIVYLVGIFTGGNVLSKFAGNFASKSYTPLLSANLATAQVRAQDEENTPPDVDVMQHISDANAYANRIATDATNEFNKVYGRMKGIETHMEKQSKSINDLIALVTPLMQPRNNVPPTPNQLYSGEL